MTPQPASPLSPAVTTPRLAALLCFLFTAAGCSFGPEPKGIRPDPGSVRKIGFFIAPDNLGAAGEPARLASMAERVAKNLGTWGYPVEADPDRTGEGYSHLMEGRVGAITHKSTPAGFSFTVGNSDPRALDFQKADALPVDCELRAAGRPRDKAGLYMDFVAGGKLKSAGDAAKGDPAVVDIYVEHIATVCFNLLEDLKVPRRNPEPAEAAAGGTSPWMPEVRIEIRDKPAGAPSAPAAAPATPPPADPVPVPASSTLKTGPAPEPKPPTAESEAPPVTTETRTNQEEGRKQMIIHNQGSPIILEFGYERK